ncbi:MAG: ComF family protein [Anaerolineae bacterium]|nr:ComF family protein [Anaerolineae bacterium]
MQRSRAVFLYKEPIRGAIHALKYRGGRQVAAALGQTMAASWLGYAMEADLLAPVPLYPGREARRGYNQATLLARELGKHLGIPMAPHVLYRVRNTLSQTKLSREQRRTNVVNAFVCAEGLDLTGCRVVLIDDVMTTGATLQACAGVLLNVGAEAVNAFTLARAP